MNRALHHDYNKCKINNNNNTVHSLLMTTDQSLIEKLIMQCREREGGRERERERGREGEREGEREGGRERGREGGRERGRALYLPYKLHVLYNH